MTVYGTLYQLFPGFSQVSEAGWTSRPARCRDAAEVPAAAGASVPMCPLVDPLGMTNSDLTMVYYGFTMVYHGFTIVL